MRRVVRPAPAAAAVLAAGGVFVALSDAATATTGWTASWTFPNGQSISQIWGTCTRC